MLVTLPPSFYNSFWSTEYRAGLEVLFDSLNQGVLENQIVADFIQSHVKGHRALADVLLDPPIITNDTTSSLQHTLLSLCGASSARGQAHKALATNLEQLLGRFVQWKDRHRQRVQAARDEMLNKAGVVGEWEQEARKLSSLRATYQDKIRSADESEDDVKFATTGLHTSTPDTYTPPKPAHANLRRSGTVADRISEKLRQAGASSNRIVIEGKALPPPPSPLRPASPSSPTQEEAFTPPSEPNGKPTLPKTTPFRMQSVSLITPTDTEVPPLPVPILLSGLSLTPTAFKNLMQHFEAYLLTTPAPYSDASMQPRKSNAALASRQRTSLLGSYDKTFSGEELVQWLCENLEGLGGDWDRCIEAATELYRLGHFGRTGVGRGFEARYDTYYTLKPMSIPSIVKSYLDSTPSHLRLRQEATRADEALRQGIALAEEKRLQMEERIERGLRIWEQWERERLSVVKSALESYATIMSALPSRLADLIPSTALSVEAFNPDADLKALIEGNRTGPFRPRAHVYTANESDVPDVNFGIDLRRWSGEFGWKGMLHAPKRPRVPDVLQGLLSALTQMYSTLDEEERRRSWIYEVPLHEVHALRSSVNSARASAEEVASVAKRFNVPTIASTVKLYLLELDPPVTGWEGWEDAKAVYPSVGADLERDVTSALSTVLARLTGVQLFVLEAVIRHFRDLLNTTSGEDDELFVAKLALSVGRCILRPQTETEITIGDRTPSLFTADLILHDAIIFPPLIEQKNKESDRVMPLRKRTALVDQRISRSRLSEEQDPRIIFEQQVLQTIRPEGPALGLTKDVMEEPADVHTAQELNTQGSTPEEESDSAPQSAEHNEASRSVAKVDTGSATASNLDTIEPASDDQPVAMGVGLKRNTSAEVSRLRGPRGARGPRPAPARVVSSTAAAPLGDDVTAAPSQEERSGGVGVTGDYTPRRGKGATAAGAFGHGSKGSVSAIAAQFEAR